MLVMGNGVLDVFLIVLFGIWVQWDRREMYGFWIFVGYPEEHAVEDNFSL